MLIQLLKKYRWLYLLAVVLIAASLMVISFHHHGSNTSRSSCKICKIAKDLSSSILTETFCPLLRDMVATVYPVDIFSPEVVSLQLAHNSRASPPR